MSVTFVDVNQALWTFSSAVIEQPSYVDGLLVNGNPPGGVDEITPAGAVLIEYDEGVAVGDGWSVNPAGVSMTFANGGTLAAGSGTVTEP